MKFYKIEKPKHLREYLLDEAAGMGNLTPTALVAPPDDSGKKKSRPDRLQIFIDKITNGGEFDMVDGSKIVLDPEANSAFLAAAKQLHPKTGQLLRHKEEIVAAIKITKGLVDTAGVPHALSQFQKSAEMGGGGGGTNAGTAGTKINETGQAIALGTARALNKSQLTHEDLTPENLKRGIEFVMPREAAAAALPDLIAKLSSPTGQQWKTTFVATTNVLHQNSEVTLKLNDKIFWRDGEFVTGMLAAFAAANEAETPTPFHHKDKWNPADIWAASKGVKPPTGLSLDDLNKWVAARFKEGTVYAISLKKTSANPTVSVYNNNPLAAPISAVLKKFIISKQNNNAMELFGNWQAGMEYDIKKDSVKESTSIPLIAYYNNIVEADSVQYRTAGGKEIRGEVQGKYAAHGNTSFNKIEQLVRTITGVSNPLTRSSTIVAQFQQDVTPLIDKIITMASFISTHAGGSAIDDKTRRQLTEQTNNSNSEQVVSKFQSIELLYVLISAQQSKMADKTAVDDFLTQFLIYNGAQSVKSSVFVKVS